MNDNALFLSKFLRHGTRIASVTPSSRWLANTTIRNIDWPRARVIVELGAGTGPITRAIAENAPPTCRVITLERDPDFAQLLRARFEGRPNFETIEGDVSDFTALMHERGIHEVDAIISGLPVPSFPSELQGSLFRSVRRLLNPSGSYNQITEIPWLYLNYYRRHFDKVQFLFEPRNLPPAGAYLCRGVKDEF